MARPARGCVTPPAHSGPSNQPAPAVHTCVCTLMLHNTLTIPPRPLVVGACPPRHTHLNWRGLNGPCACVRALPHATFTLRARAPCTTPAECPPRPNGWGACFAPRMGGNHQQSQLVASTQTHRVAPGASRAHHRARRTPHNRGAGAHTLAHAERSALTAHCDREAKARALVCHERPRGSTMVLRPAGHGACCAGGVGCMRQL